MEELSNTQLDIDRIEGESHIHERALERREDFFNALQQAQSVKEVIQVLHDFSYPDQEGVLSTAAFMQDDTDFGKSVANKDGWIVDIDIPLDETEQALREYDEGHLSEQQLYYKLILHHAVVSAVERITGVPRDSDTQAKIASGVIPYEGGEGATIDGEVAKRMNAITYGGE
jgi:hypothetical protein